MRKSIEPIMVKIHNQSFNKELSQGILANEKFIHYLQQDSLYLADFSKALALTAARLSCNQHTKQFMHFALETIKAEQALHTSYLKEHQSPVTLNIQQSPACFMYTNYLLKTASHSSVEEAVSSLLPCFWVYQEVGKNIYQTTSLNNPYMSWIELYASEEFAASVKQATDIADALSLSASDELKTKMIRAFIKSTQLEWYFWESAYNQEDWFPSNS